MSVPDKSDEVAWLRFLHEPHRRVPDICDSCRDPWPCPDARVLDRLAELEAALRDIERGGFEMGWTGSDCAGEARARLGSPNQAHVGNQEA